MNLRTFDNMKLLGNRELFEKKIELLMTREAFKNQKYFSFLLHNKEVCDKTKCLWRNSKKNQLSVKISQNFTYEPLTPHSALPNFILS